MEETFETESFGPLTIKLVSDYDSGSFINPAADDWDNGVRFVTFERNSTLSDLHKFADPEAAEADAVERGDYIFPLYKYEHGQVGYSISNASYPFNCPWDGGRVGFIFISKEAATDADNAREIARIHAGVVAEWCNGEFCGYVVEDEDGETIDSCFGFYQSDSEYALSEARAAAKHEIDKRNADQQLDIGV